MAILERTQIYLTEADLKFWTDEGKRTVPFIGPMIDLTRAALLPLRDRIVMVSGRASYELVQKCARAEAPILCAVSAPSSRQAPGSPLLALGPVARVTTGSCQVIEDRLEGGAGDVVVHQVIV